MSNFLGMEIKQKLGEIFVGQQKYARNIVKKFHMENYKSMITAMC